MIPPLLEFHDDEKRRSHEKQYAPLGERHRRHVLRFAQDWQMHCADVQQLRAVISTDGMTADYYPFEHAFLGRVAARIINECRCINRVIYDITNKPPGTIEWEYLFSHPR